MKKIVLYTALLTGTLSFFSCNEPETENPPFFPVVFKETFDAEFIQENEYLNYENFAFGNWTSFAQVGSVEWTEQNDDNNNYIQFTTFGSTTGDVTNVAWAISPQINLDNSSNEVLVFKTASEFITSVNNKLEVLISTDFDGINVTTATWTPINANVASLSTNLPSGSPDGVLNVNSGEVNLSAMTGTFYLAFKATGSSTDNNLDGSLRVDDIKIYTK